MPSNEPDALIAALKFHPSASHVNPDFRDLFNKTLDQHAAALAATAPNAGAPLAEALDEFLEAQDALDNHGRNGINAEPWEVLMRRRNAARRDLDAVMAAHAQQAMAPASSIDPAFSYASSLATALFKQHYASEPDYASGKVAWGLCDTTAGILTQIGNMVSGLVKPAGAPASSARELTDWDIDGLKQGPSQHYRDFARAVIAADRRRHAPVQQAGAPLPPLPQPTCTYADHSYPAFTKAQMTEYGHAARAGAPLPLAPSERIHDDPNDEARRLASERDQAIWDCGYSAAIDELERSAPTSQPGGALGRVESHPNYVRGFKAGHAARKKRATLPASEPDEKLTEESKYLAHRLERSLEDFPESEGITLHRGFLDRCAKALRAQPQADAAEPVAKGGEQS